METNMAVTMTRRDVSMGDLRREVGRTRDAKAARRMLAIACVMEGQSREDAADCCGVEPRGSPDMDRQTLRDWVHRFNADGLAGLANLPRRNGPRPRLSPEQEVVVAG
jgi:transposase